MQRGWQNVEPLPAVRMRVNAFEEGGKEEREEMVGLCALFIFAAL